MKPKFLEKFEAHKVFEELEENDFNFKNNLNEKYTEIRKTLKESFDVISSRFRGDKDKYEIDMNFGLVLYEVLNKHFDLTNDMIIASNQSFWIYINLYVIPDLLYKRWAGATLKTRYYNHAKRNWSSSLWWYIHLSWQGTEEETRTILEKYNSTDVIVQLTERSGRGYNLDLTRALMKTKYDFKVSASNFRVFMTLNTLYIKNVEPYFYEGGYLGYSKMLYEKLIGKESR